MTDYNHFDDKSLTHHKKIMFFRQSELKKKKPPAGKLATDVRSGDTPKPPFSTKTDEKSKKSGNQFLNRQKKNSLFPGLLQASVEQ